MLLGLKRDERREDGVEEIVYPQEVCLLELAIRERREERGRSRIKGRLIVLCEHNRDIGSRRRCDVIGMRSALLSRGS